MALALFHWVGKAENVGQVSQSTFTYNAGGTLTCTIGLQSVTAVVVTDATTSVDNLVTELNASTIPYFSGITWSNSTGTLIGTADVAGVPFTFTVSTTGGTNSWGAVSDTTACTGSAFFDNVENWRTEAGALPASAPAYSDDLVFDNYNRPCLYEIPSGYTGEIFTKGNFTGGIGLPEHVLIQDVLGSTYAEVPEYRGSLSVDSGSLFIEGSPAWVCVQLENGAAKVTVQTANTSGAFGLDYNVQIKNVSYEPTDSLYFNSGSVFYKNSIGITSTASSILYVNGATVRVEDEQENAPPAITMMGISTIKITSGSLVVDSVAFNDMSIIGGAVTIEGRMILGNGIRMSGGTLDMTKVYEAVANAYGFLYISGGKVTTGGSGVALPIAVVKFYQQTIGTDAEVIFSSQLSPATITFDTYDNQDYLLEYSKV